MNKIRDNNKEKWNNVALDSPDGPENQCDKLELDECYDLEALQPCLKQLKYNPDEPDKDCNYCLDYSYKKPNINCESDDNKQNQDNCEREENKEYCFWDEENKQCKTKLDNSKRLCIEDEKDNDNNYVENNIDCRGKDYCAKELDTKYCRQIPEFGTYETIYVFLYLIALIITYIYYRLDCISDKSFVLIILFVNILCLSLFIFLQNTAMSTEKEMATGSVDNVEYS